MLEKIAKSEWYSKLEEYVAIGKEYLHTVVQFVDKYFDKLPVVLHVLTYIILALAFVGIVFSLTKAVINNRTARKSSSKNKLMMSYFCGSGQYQAKLIYKEAHSLLRDRKWDRISLAWIAYKTSSITFDSHMLLFACSLAYVPVAVLGFMEMLFRVVIGTVVLWVLHLLHSLVLFVCKLLSLALIPLMSIIDKSMRIGQHCPSCYGTFKELKYECPNCGTIHDTLAPGTNGLFIARCGCGSKIPVSLLSGRSRLQAYCPKCETPLAAANARQLTVQLIGGNTSGKTAYLAAVQHLYTRDPQADSSSTKVIAKPESVFETLEEVYTSGFTTPSSATEATTYNFVHSVKNDYKYNLAICDTPDELILGGSFDRNPINFGYTDGIIFIIDPLAIPQVRESCIASGDTGAVYNYSSDDAASLIVEFIYQYSNIVGRASKKMIDIPVAVVINKADIKVIKREIGYPKIKARFSSNPEKYNSDLQIARNEICREFLLSKGLTNALNNLESVFSKVQYFPASSMGHGAVGRIQFKPWGVLEPIIWLSETRKNETICSSLKTAQKRIEAKQDQDADA